MYTLVGIGTLPPPLSPASVSLPPEPGGREALSPAGEGLGESQSDDLRKAYHSAYLWGKAFFISFA